MDVIKWLLENEFESDHGDFDDVECNVCAGFAAMGCRFWTLRNSFYEAAKTRTK